MVDYGRELDPRHRIELLSESQSVDGDGLVSLWTQEGALSAEQARERVPEVLFVAIDDEDGLVGVSTVKLMHIDRLRMDLWYYRTYVAREHRASSLAWLLMYFSIDHLRDRYVNGDDTRGAGIFMAVQNEGLKAARPKAIWARSRITFVGEDAAGAHLRVLYFPGSEAPAPAADSA